MGHDLHTAIRSNQNDVPRTAVYIGIANVINDELVLSLRAEG